MKFAVVLLAAVASVLAQDTTDTSAPAIPTSACIITCITQAASAAGCSSFADLTCVCTNTEFQTNAASCLQSTCTADEVQQALALQQQTCAGVSGAPSGTGTATSPTGTPTTTTDTATGTETSGAAASNAAMGYKAAFGPAGILAVVVTAVGAMAGALVVA